MDMIRRRTKKTRIYSELKLTFRYIDVTHANMYEHVKPRLRSDHYVQLDIYLKKKKKGFHAWDDQDHPICISS